MESFTKFEHSNMDLVVHVDLWSDVLVELIFLKLMYIIIFLSNVKFVMFTLFLFSSLQPWHLQV